MATSCNWSWTTLWTSLKTMQPATAVQLQPLSDQSSCQSFCSLLTQLLNTSINGEEDKVQSANQAALKSKAFCVCIVLACIAPLTECVICTGYDDRQFQDPDGHEKTWLEHVTWISYGYWRWYRYVALWSCNQEDIAFQLENWQARQCYQLEWDSESCQQNMYHWTTDENGWKNTGKHYSWENWEGSPCQVHAHAIWVLENWQEVKAHKRWEQLWWRYSRDCWQGPELCTYEISCLVCKSAMSKAFNLTIDLLILGVCAPLTVFCDAFSVITSAVSFQGWSGDLWLLCYIVFPCFLVCTVEIFVPRVSSLQSLTLGTSVLLCGLSEHDYASETRCEKKKEQISWMWSEMERSKIQYCFYPECRVRWQR